MTRDEFVKDTIGTLNQDMFGSLKETLLGEYLKFFFIEDADISAPVFEEKVCDYFEKLELKIGKPFDKQIETYISDIRTIVERKVAKAPQPKKREQEPVETPRSRKYYDKAESIVNKRSISFGPLRDYTRIMMCLYAAIIKNQYHEIIDFEYSINALQPVEILNSMKSEKKQVTLVKAKRFDIEELYSSDTATFIITIILLHKILNDKVEGEYYHE